MPSFDELTARVKRLSEVLDKRQSEHALLESYLDGDCPLPAVVRQAKLTNLYRDLMTTAEAPWGSLIVDSKLDRLEISGLRDTDQATADRIWANAWQANGMDAESKLAHGAALLDGRCYATVWPGPNGEPEIALDDVTQMVVEFAEGSRRKRVAALRRWIEGGQTLATLYLPDGLYKFKRGEGQTEWQKRVVDGESWPLANPFAVVPVVEIAINRRLKPGSFPYARGEFAHATGLIDRIHLLTFLGLVVAIWLGFPLRGVIGEKLRRRVLRDDEGNAIIDEETGKEKSEALPPFEARPDSVFQLENPDAKLAEFAAADRSNLSVFAELEQLATVTKTPRHYFPMEGGISNIATDTVMAYEGAMHAAVTGHKATMGEGWEDVNRLSGAVLGKRLSPQAEMVWTDSQSRSLAERADAASKLKDLLPPMVVAEIALNATQDQIARWQSQAAMDPLMALVAAVGNGSGPSGVTAG